MRSRAAQRVAPHGVLDGIYPGPIWVPRLRDVAALFSPSTRLLGVVPQPTDSRVSRKTESGSGKSHRRCTTCLLRSQYVSRQELFVVGVSEVSVAADLVKVGWIQTSDTSK